MTELGALLFGFGLDGDDLNAIQMALRAVIVYGATIAIIRLGKRRFMSHASGVDLVVGITIGAIVSRAIVGSSPFLPALAAAGALIATHWFLSWTAYRSPSFSRLLKGEARVLIENGIVHRERLREAHVSDGDLWEELRGQGIEALDDVKAATLERSGKISVVKRKDGRSD